MIYIVIIGDMKITNQASDAAVLAELGERLSRTRLNADRSQAEVAKEAGVSKRTLERIEAGESTQTVSLIRVLRALGLGDRLDALAPEPVPSPLQQLELQGKQRERASRSSTAPTRPWTWADEP